MKHDWKTTLSLIVLFFVAQLIGIHILSYYIDAAASTESGSTVINEDLYIIDPPSVGNESFSWLYILGAVLIGTVLVLIIARFKSFQLWRFWFFFSILIGLALAFVPYVAILLEESLGLQRAYTFAVAGALAFVLAFWKTYKPNALVHNFTELFVYGGIASLFVPLLNIFSAVILLLAISAYDAYAVWKSRHMVTLATFQAESKLFAGLFIPKGEQKPAQKVTAKIPAKPTKQTSSHAILGGGDIAFPLLFAGAVIKYTNNPLAGVLIIIGSTVALLGLMLWSKEGKFYPAMPFISAGCFVGYGLALLL